MKSAVILTSDNYPCGDAGAVRQHAISKILQHLGYNVLVLGYGKPTNGIKGTYDNVDYVTFRPNSTNILVRIAYRIVSNHRMLKYLRKHVKQVDVLVVVGLQLKSFYKLERYAQKHNCMLVHDSVEWYSPEEYKNGERNRSYRANEKVNSEIMDENWRVIAISRYLQEHFEKRCEKTAYVPVIMDVQTSQYREQPVAGREKIRFVYAGAPGKKDYLAQLLEGFSMLDQTLLEKLEIRMVGTTKQQLSQMCGVSEQVLEKLKDCLTVLGRVPREQAVQEVMDADYSMLLRDSSLRYAKAGFPTKIVESLMCGTPVFCNLSSDLELYLRDGQNAVLINDHTPEAVKLAVEKALEISLEQRSAMRRCARETAESNFDYRHYNERLKELLQ